MHMGTGTHHEAICGVFWSRDITGITNIRRDRDRRKFAYIGIPSWRINLINQSSSTFGSLTYSVLETAKVALAALTEDQHSLPIA